jgi:uncharacterized membrane protein YphA (DoxX/SURF4 family)
MRLLTKPQHLPARIAIGAFVLNSGVTKLKADDQAAAGVHGFATGTYPFLKRLRPKVFTRLLGASEVVLGSALVLPAVPSVIAGSGLAVFSGGLLGLYFKTPGMRRPGTPLPTQEGMSLAKDIWMTGAALTLIVDDLTGHC